MPFWPFRRRPTPAPSLPSEDLLVTEEQLRRAAEDVMEIRERQIRGGVIILRGRLRTDASSAVTTLLGRFQPFGYTPFLRAERDGVSVQAWPLGDMTQPARPALALTLFGLTVISTFLAGAFFFVGSDTFDAYRAMAFPGWIIAGTPFALTLLTILGVHEFGHYFTARYYGAAVSLPYFIPAPVLFGTFGAVIRMRSPARDRNALFDIAAAGPLAGLLIAIPALVLGLTWSRLVPATGEPSLGGFGYSLLTRLFVHLRFGEVQGMAVVTHPIADAAWVGCFVTALNLFPVGQLDGGRIAYALSSRAHRTLGVATWVVLLVMGALTGSINWFIWAGLLLFLVGFEHSPSLDELTPLSGARRLIGVVCLALAVVLVPPVPI